MDGTRRLRLAAPLAVLALLATAGASHPARLHAADPPWDPPPCPPGSAADDRAGAWFRLEGVLDDRGWLVGQRLRVGTADDAVGRRIELPPESFATGAPGGRVLVGADDGSRSRLRLVDAVGGCADELGGSTAVIRGAVVDAAGGSVLEHRVNRRTRADEGVWRRPVDGGRATRILPGIAPGPRFGRTYATALVTTSDGRLAVASCGELACRVRVVDPLTGRMGLVEPSGTLLGVAGGAVVAYRPCPGLPCPIESIDIATGHRSVVAPAAGWAALGGKAGRLLALELPDGGLEAVDLGTGAHRRIEAPGLAPLGPLAAGVRGVAGPPGWVVLAAPGGRPDAARLLDPATLAVVPAGEVLP